MVTLAMAKAHTDSKVGGGGSGSQGEELVISTAEYGVNILPLILTGGGYAEFNGTKEMWDAINENRNFVFKTPFEGMFFYMRPIEFCELYGMYYFCASQIIMHSNEMGGIVTANVVFIGDLASTGNGGVAYTGNTQVFVTVSVAPVPGV